MLLTSIRTEKLGQPWLKHASPSRTTSSSRRSAKERRIELDCEEFEEGLRRSLAGSSLASSGRAADAKQKLSTPQHRHFGLGKPFRFDFKPTAPGAKVDFSSSCAFGASPTKSATLSFVKTTKPASGVVQDSLQLIDCRKKVKKMLEWNFNKPATTIEDLKRTLNKGDRREDKNAKIDSAFLKKLVRPK